MTPAIACIGLTALLAAPPVAQVGTVDSFAVRAKELWLDSGQRVEDGVLWVEGGKIRAAGRGVEVPEGTSLIEHQGVLTAGLIAFDCRLGIEAADFDPKRSVHPEGRVADVFDTGVAGVAGALREGITCLVLRPSASSLVGGTSAVVKTAHRTVVSSEAHLALGISNAALANDRFPTSKSGALAELERLFREPEGPFAAAAAGRLPVWIEVDERDDVRRALALVEAHGLTGVLGGSRRAGELASALAESGLTVAVGPFLGGTAQRELDGVVALGLAGVPLCFALEAPARHGAGLRISAAMCMRAGLDATAAWSALTAGAARAAGVEERVGRLASGLDADFVLWSGNPLDLQSRPEAVFVDGLRVWQGGAR
jgi:imidazolonepropionase-like amidohydrolase